MNPQKTHRARARYLRACFEINFDPLPPGGSSRDGGIVAAVLKQTDATKRVPPFIKHSLSLEHLRGKMG